METLNQVLKVLFEETRSEDVIDAYLDKRVKYVGIGRFVDERIFCQQMVRVNMAHTLDQAEVLYHVLSDKWSKEDTCVHELLYCKESNVFNVLLHFSHNKVYLKHHLPICKYQELFSWHEVTRDFGEDLLLTSYLAAYDLKNQQKTNHFDWAPYIGHDSTELNQMFRHEMMDLHAHLNGSSLNFELNWMNLMNHICGHEVNFAKLDSLRLSFDANYRFNHNSKSLYMKVMMAAAIRVYLYVDIINDNKTEKISLLSNISDILSSGSLIQTLMYEQEIQNAIDIVSQQYGRRYEDKLSSVKYIPDYAITGKDDNIFSVLGGERKFMYRIFRKIYSGEYYLDRKTSLFYIYLLIKEELRKELVQVNTVNGFANFSLYQDRKDQFLYNGQSLYERLLSQMAVGSFMSDSTKKRYMEVRIAPKKTMVQDYLAIKKKDSFITDKVFDRNHAIDAANFYYIFHFIKKNEKCDVCDNGGATQFELQPRHVHLRQEVATQAKAIYALRNHSPFVRKRLVGIDAANSEIFCRPEVFAQAFRYLGLNSAKQVNDDTSNNDLGLTYHVGEDFYDIVDGIRAVDEVLKFMHFRNGARLGHALVLGTDANSYYQKRNFRINATKQVLLDNVAWLYVQGARLGASNKVLSYLKELYHLYFMQVFFNAIHEDVDIFTYYQSWLLRGDDPAIYHLDAHNGKIALERDASKEYMDCWFSVAQNHGIEIDDAHGNSDALYLFYLYHYHKQVRKVGSEGEVLRIKPQYRDDFISLIIQVQEQFLCKLEHLHVSIECNPSSNFKIGEMERYDQHPIVKFYNRGLNTLYPHHDICVSINTDDAGVFATSLEREYSLMALAMEKEETNDNSPRSVMEWLNSIRRMTKEQCFCQHDD